MSDPRVSVILPTYNRAPTLGRAIDSVLAQTYRDFELIVVDDASTDATAEVIRAYPSERVRCHRMTENCGAAAARNAGIRNAAGAYLAFQDSDDEWLPGKLQAQVDVMEADPTLCVAYGDMERVRANGRVEPFPAPTVATGRIVDPMTGLYQVHNLGIQSALLRRSLLDRDPPFDERLPMLEDLELFLRLAADRRFRRIPGVVVRYHESQGLSANDRQRTVARDWLLRLHGSRIRREHPRFFWREWLNVHRAKWRYRNAG